MRRLALGLVTLLALAGCGSPFEREPPAYDPVTPCEPMPPATSGAAGALASRLGRAGRPALDRLLPSARATSPTPNLRLGFEVCDPDAFYREGSRAVVRLLVVTGRPEQVDMGVELGDGVQLVAGSFAFSGMLGGTGFDPVDVRDIEAVVRGEPGHRELGAWSEIGGTYGTYGSRNAPGQTVALDGDPADGRSVEPRPRDRIDVIAEVHAEAADPSRVEVVFWADRSWDGRAQLSTGATLEAGGDQPVPFALAPFQARRLSTTVDLPDEWVRGEYDGTYAVGVFVYPHPRLWGGVEMVMKHYDIQDGRIVVLDEEPRDPGRWGTQTPGPCKPC